MTQKIKLHLTRAHAAYLAGIIDGEGYIGLCKSNKRSFALRMVVTSGNKQVLRWISAVTGFGKVSTFDLAHRNRNVSYQWRAFSAEAGALLKEVRPHLIIKYLQAEIAIRFEERKRGLCGDARREYGKECSERIKLLNSKKALPLRGGPLPRSLVRCQHNDLWSQL